MQQPKPVPERVNLSVTHRLPGEVPWCVGGSTPQGGISCRPHQSKYISGPTLTSIKVHSVRPYTDIDYLSTVAAHGSSALPVACVGSGGTMQLYTIETTIFPVR